MCLSFKRILARFSKCSSQMTGQNSFKLDFKFFNFYINIDSAARAPAAER